MKNTKKENFKTSLQSPAIYVLLEIVVHDYKKSDKLP